jgi:hypothetical protein
MDPANGTSQDTSTTESEISPSPETIDDSSVALSPEPTDGQSSEEVSPAPADKSPIGEALDAFSKELGRPKFDAKKEGDKEPAAPEVKPVAAPTQKPVVARSYEGLDADEVKLFKHIGNEQYRTLYPRYIEAKGLKGQLEATKVELEKLKSAAPTYDNESAYRLDPDYEKLTSNASRIEAEIQYWKEQLTNVETPGGKFVPISFNPSTGEYSYGEPIDASPAVKTQIIDNLTKAYSIHQKYSSQVNEFQNTYKNQHQTYLGNMNATRTKLLGGLDAPTIKALEKASATKLELFPANVRGKPEVKMLAELLVVNEGLIKVVQELKGKAAGAVIVNRTAKAAGPANVTGGAAVGGKETIGSAMDEFKKAGMGRFATMA